MPLKSRLFAGDAKLEAAAVANPAHIVPGAVGEHVSKIQRALILLDDGRMSTDELRSGRYGRSTAQAVLAYKSKRRIINFSYESQADDIVGVMTMAALDAEMVTRESRKVMSRGCGDPVGRGKAVPVRGHTMLAFGVAEGDTRTGGARGFPADLSVVMMWTTAGLAEPKSRQWRYFEKATEVLAPFSLKINVLASPGEVPSNILVDPRNKSDIWSVRKAAQAVMPGRPETLRIIGCPFERTDPPYYALTESGTLDGSTFADFILLNARLVRPDQCTVAHEMLHASSRADGRPTTLIDRWHHDTDPASIYSEGPSRTVLKPDYAQALSESFFARPR